MAGAQAVKIPPQRVLKAYLEGPVVGTARGDHVQIGIEHKQGHAGRVHDCLRERTCIANFSEGSVINQASTLTKAHELSPAETTASRGADRNRAPLSPASSPIMHRLGGTVGNVDYRNRGPLTLGMFLEGEKRPVRGPIDNIHKMPS